MLFELKQNFKSASTNEKSCNFSLLETVGKILNSKGIIERDWSESQHYTGEVCKNPFISVGRVDTDEFHLVVGFLVGKVVFSERFSKIKG
jgi:hypothetical protein